MAENTRDIGPLWLVPLLAGVGRSRSFSAARRFAYGNSLRSSLQPPPDESMPAAAPMRSSPAQCAAGKAEGRSSDRGPMVTSG